MNVSGLDVVQENYSLAYRSKYENGLKTFVQTSGISNTPYFSLAKGFLTGNYRMDTPTEKYQAAHGGTGVLEYKEQIFVNLVEECERIAERHSSSIAAVSLAWLRAQSTVVSPIASARTLEQLKAIAMVVHLSEEELLTLTLLSSNF
jgi:aryl-alcohol dehydrogenase-like predicted oxidoreductase